MEIISKEIPEVKILQAKKHGDHRGFFSETYNVKALEAAGIKLKFVQDNHSLSGIKGTLRGLHFQTPPFAQDKLVRVIKGSILDVAVDLRKNSPTYGKHVAEIISAEKWNQILVPVGFAHGFVTLESDTEVIYKVTNFYSPENDKGLLWEDPALKIDWPFKREEIILSEKDKTQPLLADLPVYFNI